MLNIVVPMAGRGSRFQKEGYAKPKPLLEIHGVPMIDVVIRNLRPKRQHRFIFLCLDEHIKHFGLVEELSRRAPGSLVLPVDQVTEGAACTVLLAKSHIDCGDQLMIANSDQWVDVDIDDYLVAGDGTGDGIIMTMEASDPKWSFVELGKTGLVTRVVEKEVVSHEATVGVYNFRQGSDFVSGAEAMIQKDLRVNGEFYVAPVYNELISRRMHFGIFNVGSENAGMYGLGTPEDFERFLRNPLSRRAAGW